MNHKLKRKWIAALRGGTYTQCFYSLGSDAYDDVYSDGKKYRCALGVLQDVLKESDERVLFDFHVSNYQRRQIMTLNDVERLTLPQIADWVEDNL